MTTKPITHIINSLSFGGAESMLCNLVTHYDRERFPTTVVTLIDDHTLAEPLLNVGVPIVTMGMRPGIPDPRTVVRLARFLKRERPAVVQTWMDHSNLIGGAAARAVTNAPVVWGIHHVNHDAGVSKPTTRLTVAACARVSSRLPSTIVCCSEASRAEYTRLGFEPSKMQYIPNGFNSVAFAPDPEQRIAVRSELGIEADAILIGLAARFDPLKDHANFLGAAAIVARSIPSARFLLCGSGVDRENGQLMSLIQNFGICDKCYLIGPRRDMPRIFASLDIAASSSISEAFPLAVGEAMSTGVPCVGTNVGDTAQLIGPTGKVVPSRSPEALADALIELISLDAGKLRELGRAARERIRKLFDLDAVSRLYEEIYESVTSTSPVSNSLNRGLLLNARDSS